MLHGLRDVLRRSRYRSNTDIPDPIDSQHHRERQLILAEMGDLLFGSIFVKQEVFFVQTADDARSVLLQHQRIDFDEIDIDLDDIR